MGKIIDAWVEFVRPRMYGRGNGKTTSASVILDNLCRIKSLCNTQPTCGGCPFREEYKGCMFRGRSPREW